MPYPDPPPKAYQQVLALKFAKHEPLEIFFSFLVTTAFLASSRQHQPSATNSQTNNKQPATATDIINLRINFQVLISFYPWWLTPSSGSVWFHLTRSKLGKNIFTNLGTVQSYLHFPCIHSAVKSLLSIASSCISPNAYQARIHNFPFYILCPW